MKKVATAVPAATVLLLRDGSEGLEVFMVVRHHQIDFAAGALVFPGGKTAPGDSAPDLRACCQGADDLSDTELALRVAAIREAFEECGVLLARPVGEDYIIPGQHLAALEHYRPLLEKGNTSMGAVCADAALRLACDQLVPFAHWVTPPMMPKRFVTHFFLAEAPADHVLMHCGGEMVDSVWISPRRALAEADEGARLVIFPTRLNLMKLARSNSVAEALAAAAHDTIVRVEPWIEERDGRSFLCIPPEAGYGITAAPLDAIQRA